MVWSKFDNLYILGHKSLMMEEQTKKYVQEFFSFLFFYFNLYIYPPDLQESGRGANTYGRQLP